MLINPKIGDVVFICHYDCWSGDFILAEGIISKYNEQDILCGIEVQWKEAVPIASSFSSVTPHLWASKLEALYQARKRLEFEKGDMHKQQLELEAQYNHKSEAFNRLFISISK